MDSIIQEAKTENLKEIIKDVDLTDTAIIQDNKLPFLVGDKLYQVRMPTQQELSLAEAERNRIFLILLQDTISVTKKQLKALLRVNKKIDIDSLEQEKEQLEKQLHDKYISLAQTQDNEKINKLKTEIQEIKAKHLDIFYDIETYLSASIENQIDNAYLKFLVSCCTEYCNEETKQWVPFWKTYNEFQKDNSLVAIQARLHFGYLFRFQKGF